MNGLPYYKAYPRDFIEGTIGMDFETKAAYRLVLDLIYMQGGNLPDDARYISGLLGCTVRKWNSLRGSLVAMGKIIVNGEFLTNERAIIELETLRKLQDKQAENRSRPNKNKGLKSPRFNQSEPEPKEAKASNAQVREAVADLSQKQNLDVKDLTKRLTEAADGKIQPHGALVVAAILELINNGVDLETDILPTIRAVATRMSKPANSWAYFIGAIRDAYNNRIKAGAGLVKPATVTKIDVFALPQAEQERKLEFFLEQARLHRRWNPRLGALPWQDGCRIPEHLLKPDDGKGWQVIGVAA
ncbi:DUF1376 domain-containing protein [Pseudochrobactrum asaccharolyticum]|uniref:Uncharacterized protein YdaU (DUF1376 family) n=1 Tax=Pseudochrobactrum asaccharolyticum TaxID=354351 RepID=A0A366DPM6_9HYPH|nr:DUF1376 domain-containing protein [Pseudochrobactrum asaccharolyticum]RBO91865.1 uncharacterized protein YdaU (DUF1376 family) [Pseudochrobactrum asaccharolyticum]